MFLKQRNHHQRQGSKLQKIVTALSAALSLGAAGPLLAAPAPLLVAAADAASASSGAVADMKPDHACMGDLRTFSDQMQKEGYWLRGSSLGYGYPMYGYGYGYGYGYEADRVNGTLGAAGDRGTMGVEGYSSVRPGYEIRMLIGSASVLAERGESEACRAVLGAARNLYGRYAADMREGKYPRADVVGWKQRQLAGAKPVMTSERAFRSDQLIGTDVLTTKGEDLGSVSDLVMSPKTGKISYLVIGRGGIFGIGEKYVPVPWDRFKATAGLSMLVLDTSKSTIDAAPQVRSDAFSPHGDFASQSEKIDAYWKGKVGVAK